jgi:hypothetical protein
MAAYTFTITSAGPGVSEINLVMGVRKYSRRVASEDVATLKRYAHEILVKDLLSNSGAVSSNDDLLSALSAATHPERATYTTPIAPQVIEIDLAADRARAVDQEVIVSGKKFVLRAKIDAVSLATAVAEAKAEPIEEPIEEVKG